MKKLKTLKDMDFVDMVLSDTGSALVNDEDIKKESKEQK